MDAQSPDTPFVLRGGNDEQTAIYNRISAIERIKFLSGVDLTKKGAAYLQALDLEMYKTWYKDEPATKEIDEVFCKRAAQVIKSMSQIPDRDIDEEYLKTKVYHETRLEEFKNADQQPQSNQKASDQANEQDKD